MYDFSFNDISDNYGIECEESVYNHLSYDTGYDSYSYEDNGGIWAEVDSMERELNAAGIYV